jgi:predicted nucleic acid-binding Zn ribbon protein
MKRRESSLTPLKDVLSGLFGKRLLPFDPADAELWKIWPSVVGEAAAAHARPLWIKDGVLKVVVTEPVWLNELRFASEEIRSSLNATLGRPAVRQIQFRTDPSRSQQIRQRRAPRF